MEWGNGRQGGNEQRVSTLTGAIAATTTEYLIGHGDCLDAFVQNTFRSRWTRARRVLAKVKPRNTNTLNCHQAPFVLPKSNFLNRQTAGWEGREENERNLKHTLFRD